MSNISIFPEGVDVFEILSDITIDDIDNKNEYKELMNMTYEQRQTYSNWQGRVDELANLLKGKMLRSDYITKLQSAIANLQIFALLKDIHISDTEPVDPPTFKLWIDTSEDEVQED